MNIRSQSAKCPKYSSTELKTSNGHQRLCCYKRKNGSFFKLLQVNIKFCYFIDILILLSCLVLRLSNEDKEPPNQAGSLLFENGFDILHVIPALQQALQNREIATVFVWPRLGTVVLYNLKNRFAKVLVPTDSCKALPSVRETVAEGKHNASVNHTCKTVLVSNHYGFFVFCYGFQAFFKGQNVVVVAHSLRYPQLIVLDLEQFWNGSLLKSFT